MEAATLEGLPPLDDDDLVYYEEVDTGTDAMPADVGETPEDSDDDLGDQIATASAALADPFGHIAKARTKLLHYEAPEVDLEALRVGQGKLSVDIIEAVVDAEIERTIEGASTLTITLSDPSGKVRKSRLMSATVNVHLEDHDYRLANVAKDGTQLTLTFETLNIARLRSKKGYKRMYRRTHKGGKGVTRAEFALALVRELKKPRIPVSIPELHIIQPVERYKKGSGSKTDDVRGRSREQGLSDSLKIKGQPISDHQRQMLSVALSTADNTKGATTKSIEAMLCSGIQESAWRDIMQGNFVSVEVFKHQGSDAHPGTNGYGGPLQGDVAHNRHVGPFYKMKPEERCHEQAKSFLEGGRGYQGGGAIKLAKGKGLTPGAIAVRVEASGESDHIYQQWLKEARAILKEWGHGAAGGTVSYTRTRKYAFIRHKDQNSWDCIQDLAQETVPTGEPLGWRAFFVKNRFYFVSEQQLFKSRSRMTLSEEAAGVDTIDFEYDRGHPVGELTIKCRARFWTAPPGTIVTIEKMGVQVDGRWLVISISRRRGSLDTTIVCHKPQREMPEPAPEVEIKSEQVAGSGDMTSWKHLGSGRVYPLPIRGKNLGGPAAHHARAFGNWMSDDAIDIGVPMGTEVYAVGNGEITKTSGAWHGGASGTDGLRVYLKTGGREWCYMHLKDRVPLKIGQQISAGDLLGHTGAGAGVPHLHIACTPGDPEQLLGWGELSNVTAGHSPAHTGQDTAMRDGVVIAAWIAPAVDYAKAHGWTGRVGNGYRTYEEQKYLYEHPSAHPGTPAAKPGTSNHEGSIYPKGAIDVSNPSQFADALTGYNGKKLKQGLAIGDPIHFSATGH